MLNFTASQQDILTRFTEDMSNQSIIEDLMLMYSAYVDYVSDLENFTVGKETILDIQAKLFTVQRVLEVVAVINDAEKAAAKHLKKAVS